LALATLSSEEGNRRIAQGTSLGNAYVHVGGMNSNAVPFTMSNINLVAEQLKLHLARLLNGILHHPVVERC
jgi:hypothetical protein